MKAHELSIVEIKKGLEHPDPNERYQFAIQLLEINEQQFSRIHTKQLKADHLKYCWLLTEFTFIQSKTKIESDPRLHYLYTAYNILKASPKLFWHDLKYSTYSKGLQEFDLRNIYQPEAENDKSTSDKETLLQSIMFEKPKSSGVWPGFEAFEVVDILFYLYEKYPLAEDRWQYIIKYSADIKQIYELNKDFLPNYLIKGDFKKISKDGIVTPALEDLMRSKTMKNISEKSSLAGKVASRLYMKAKEENFKLIAWHGVEEVLGNDIANVYGILTQEQTLLRSYYHDGRLKLLLKGRWVKGADILGPVFGSKDNKSYRATPVLFSRNGITHLSDHSIKNLPEALPAMIVLGDRDGIGSSAQNKLHLNKQFVCIDTGHAFESDIVDKVTEFFNIMDGRFKNYTIFLGSRSSTMRGLIKLARVAGHHLSENVIKSYGTEFYDQVMQLAVGSDEMVFDDYITKFLEIRTTCTRQDNIECCSEIIKNIHEIKATTTQIRDRLINKFQKYLLLEQKAVDLTEAIEKFFLGNKGTFSRSPDNTTLLQYLRVDESKIAWKIAIPTQVEGRITFEVIFQKHAFDSSLQNLQNWMRLNGKTQNQQAFFKVDEKRQAIIFDFPSSNLSYMVSLFNEDRLMKHFFPNDYNNLIYYTNEKELYELIAQLESYGLKTAISKTDTHYKISFDHKISPDVLMLFKKYFTIMDDADSFLIPANKDALSQACNAIKTILFENNREQLIAVELLKINKLEQKLKKIQPNAVFMLTRSPNSNQFSCVFDISKCSAAFKHIVTELKFDWTSIEASQDLVTVQENLTICIERYNETIIADEQLYNNIQDKKYKLQQHLAISFDPFVIDKILPGNYKVLFNQEFINLFQKISSKSNQLSDECIFVTSFNIESFYNRIDQAASLYHNYLKDREALLSYKVEEVNKNLQKLLGTNLRIISIRSNEDNQLHDIAIDEMLLPPELFAVLKPLLPRAKIELIEPAMHNIELTIESYVKLFDQLHQLNIKLSQLFKIDTHIFNLGAKNNNVILSLRFLIQQDNLSADIENILIDFQQNAQLTLTQRLRNLVKGCERLLTNGQLLIDSCRTEIKAYLNSYPDLKTQLIDIKFMNGNVRFRLYSDDSFVMAQLSDIFGKKDLGGYFEFTTLAKVKDYLEKVMLAYDAKKFKDELLAEGFEFMDEYKSDNNDFNKLIDELIIFANDLAVNNTKRESLVTTKIANFLDFMLNAPPSKTPVISLKNLIDRFVIANDTNQLCSFRAALHSQLSMFEPSQINIVQKVRELIKHCDQIIDQQPPIPFLKD